MAGAKTQITRKKKPKSLLLNSSVADNYPPYNYLNEDGELTGIDEELATEVVQKEWDIRWMLSRLLGEEKELAGEREIDCIMAVCQK